MSGESDLVDIAAELRVTRERAYLLYDGTKEVWVPRSLVEDNGDGTFTLPYWLAHREGLI